MQTIKRCNISSARNSSVEMLRIVAMAMIVVSHASFHGGFPDRSSIVEFNNHFLNWMVLGNLGANLFVLITGYYFCTKQFNRTWVLKPLTQVWFYSILCAFIHVIAGGTLSGKNLVTILLPTIFKEYWFFTAYLVLMLIAPYINVFIKNASQKQFRNCLVTMLMLWCVIFSFTNQNMYSSEMIRFVMYYLIGAYLRVYPDNFLTVNKTRNRLAFGSLFLLFLSSTVIRFVNENIVHLISETSFTNPFSVITLGASVGLFSVAAYHTPWTNTFVNTIASCTFGVYLLHDNPFMRELIWKKWMDNTAWYDSGLLMIRIFFSVLLVFMVCIPVELLRQRIVAQPFLKKVEKIFDFLYEKYKHFGCSIFL